jgi:signal transduction histidine kinase
MQLLFILLQAQSASRSDSTFQSIEKIKPNSLLSLENPVVFSIFILAVVLGITFIFARYVIIPMRKKHLEKEENLRLQQAEMMALFAELSPDPIFRCDTSGKITLANDSAHRLFPERTLLGNDIENIFDFVKKEELHDIITEEKRINCTSLLGDHYFQFIIAGINKLDICQIYGRDITDLKLTEINLKVALVKAEEAKKLKEYFVSQISHEIRSPLNVIMGYADLLSEELKNQNDGELLPILLSMKNNSKRLYRTFDLLLNISLLQTGKYAIRYENVDLYALIKTLFLEFNSLAEEKGIIFNLHKEIPGDVFVVADHYAISQVITNIIDNSIKYTLKGHIDINIYIRDENLCVDISDTGKGMSEEYIKNLFIPFSQEDMGYSREFDGTGLGLAIVKSFADLNKAKINVKSEINVGTTFTIIFTGENKWKVHQ